MALLIAVTLALCSQFRSINAIMYYGPRTFKDSGATESQEQLFQVIIGAVNYSYHRALSMWLMDRFGRKKLFGFGSLVQCVAPIFLVTLFVYVVTRSVDGKLQLPTWALWGMLGGVLLFISAFAIGNFAVCSIIISEIFPNSIHGVAASIGTAAIWDGCFILSQLFPWMLANYGPAKIFAIFSAVSLFGSLFIYLFVPETKGRTLEEIEKSWRKKFN